MTSNKSTNPRDEFNVIVKQLSEFYNKPLMKLMKKCLELGVKRIEIARLLQVSPKVITIKLQREEKKEEQDANS